MTFSEQAWVFDCKGERLVGVLAAPAAPGPMAVAVVVGGPQYRVGSHRQFVLLARHLAEQGIPTLRFDYRGMGDSEGAARSFEAVDADVRAALDALFDRCPELRGVTLWGLCDGASAALMYAAQDPRVRGLVLVNPWVRSEQSLAHVHLKHYYRHRIASSDFWRKLATGRLGLIASVRSLLGSVRRAARPAAALPYQQRMLAGLRDFRGEVLVVLSGNDMVAREFEDHCRNEADWRRRLHEGRIVLRTIEAADHTFSSPDARCELEQLTGRWVNRLERRSGRSGASRLLAPDATSRHSLPIGER